VNSSLKCNNSVTGLLIFEPTVTFESRISVVRQNQHQNRERFYERAVKKKVSPKPPKVLGSWPLNTPEAAQLRHYTSGWPFFAPFV
jgi:hypothetical protein